jgi:hypothetical protein
MVTPSVRVGVAQAVRRRVNRATSKFFIGIPFLIRAKGRRITQRLEYFYSIH